MTREELQEYLIEEAEYQPGVVESADTWHLLNMWLMYEGIYGYTSQILEVIEAASGIKIMED